MRIETDRLVLRDLNEGDKLDLVKNVNNLEVSKNLELVPYPYTEGDAEWFINKCVADVNKNPRENYEFGIELKSGEEFVGCIGLTKIDRFVESACIGYWLGEDHWRNGIMSEAFKKILDFAFNELGLRRIDISAWTENEGSNALIKKMGFVYEGKRIQAKRSKATGDICDIYVYGLLKEDWKNGI